MPWNLEASKDAFHVESAWAIPSYRVLQSHWLHATNTEPTKLFFFASTWGADHAPASHRVNRVLSSKSQIHRDSGGDWICAQLR